MSTAKFSVTSSTLAAQSGWNSPKRSAVLTSLTLYSPTSNIGSVSQISVTCLLELDRVVIRLMCFVYLSQPSRTLCRPERSLKLFGSCSGRLAQFAVDL